MAEEHKMSAFDKRADSFFKNYQEEGMIRWTEPYIGDYRKELQKIAEERKKDHKKKPEMNMDSISKVVMKAYKGQHRVVIQMKTTDKEGRLLPDISGIIEGYLDTGTIVIAGDLIDLDKVNNIQLAK